MNITSTLHSTAFHQPGHIAVVDDKSSVTYSELSASVKKIAEALKKNGIGPGHGVGVMGVNSIDFIIMAYAVMESGAVMMPVSAQINSDELKDMMTITGFHALIHDGNGPASTDANEIILDKSWKILFAVADDEKTFESLQVPHPALVRFTSGTTGKSKGVLLSHETIEARTRVANDALELGPEDTVIWVLSMAYHFVVSIILYIRYGCTIAICNNFHASGILKTINDNKGTFLYASPMHIRMLAGDHTAQMMTSMKRVISTSSGITKEHCDSFKKRYGIPVSQAYGIIEAGLPVINLKEAESVPEAIGHPIKAFRVEVLDDDGNLVAPGITGNLAVRGPGMFDAYLFPLQLRHDLLRNGWFFTGDTASKDEKGLLRITGRTKSMINVAGNKVFPEEVEAVLNRHPAVKTSKISGEQHHLLGEIVKAEIVLKENENPTTENLRNHCLQHLSSYKVPQHFIFVNELPMTDSGKIKR